MVIACFLEDCRGHDSYVEALHHCLGALVKRVARIEHKEDLLMSTIGDVNAKLDELVKDVRRVLALVSNEPVSAATQAEVDALADRLDAIDTEVEQVSPEPTSEGDSTVPA